MNTKTTKHHFVIGILMTVLVAVFAIGLSQIPYLHIVGPLVLAILLGIIIASSNMIDSKFDQGIRFSSKKLLRVGIVLLGLRLNVYELQSVGLGGLMYALGLTSFALISVYGLTQLFKIDRTLGLLLACGTAICGAAAIAAVAPIIRAKDTSVAISIATIALLGTTFTLIFTFSFSFLNLTELEYGYFVGGTLHEIAHVVAASSVGGPASEDAALLIKLTRVILLVPIAVMISVMYRRKTSAQKPLSWSNFPIPWFIVGFLMMSLIHTSGILQNQVVEALIQLSYFLLAMAMAGLGLSVQLKAFKQVGVNLIYAGVIGSIALIFVGYLFVTYI